MAKERLIKILIVEDSLLTRIGLMSIYSWEENGFTIIGMAENGKQAMEIIDNEVPDIILSDIRMPVMNGIQLLREVKDQGLPCHFIMLSAYDDFLQVKEAMKLGADEYILKLDLEADRLLTICKKISKQILEEEKDYNSRKLPVSNDTTDTYLAVNQLLLCKNVSKATLERLLRKAHLPEDIRQVFLVLIQRDTSSQQIQSEDRKLMDRVILQTSSEILRRYGNASGCITDHSICALIFCPFQAGSAFSSSQMDSIKAKFFENIQLFFTNIPLNISSIEVSDGITGIADAYIQGKLALNSKPASKTVQNVEAIPFNAQIESIELALDSFDIDKIKNSFDSLIETILSNHDLVNKQLYGVCHTIIHVLDKYVSHNKLEELDWNRSNELITLAKVCYSASDYANWLSDLSLRIINALEYSRKSSRIVITVKRYISENYAKNISLNDASDFAGVSPAYLSRLFSSETGKSFTDYIAELRINNAKELLRSTNEKIKAIGEAVGYNDSYYFSRIFKKYSGLSPQEYRNSESKK